MPATEEADPTGPGGPGAPVDVVSLGESMVTFLPSRPGRLADVPAFTRTIGGAESNVACALAAAGHTVRWISRVGADGFGDHLLEAIGAYGVDTSAVRRDADGRPTGIYFRTATDRSTTAHEVVYYRAGSAASAMSPRTMDLADLWSGRVLHLSGITAALSDDCLALMRELSERRAGRPLLSFDVNHRPALWRDDSGPRVLLDLARGADLVFVGDDEAAQLWDLHSPEAIREALPEPAVLVVKAGANGATAFVRHPGTGTGTGTGAATGTGTGTADSATDTVTSVPALAVDVVAPVGAGDAFAAGFLSATLRDLPTEARLRHGHLTAAAVLTDAGDVSAPPSRAHADRLAALDDAAWAGLRLGPGWTSGAAEPGQRQEAVPAS
ncbi:carbohydrate kinase [Streptomyces niveus]|uniref:Carbohydrate kinase n=2 Tax=Streptomyces niveus TaxID=193462 RepID=A0A1U9QT18_STRNV|nr:sugar kinase [Streptomyces niveus]AQU66795.1 carbohydrate kinase [Streptomyces niveus]